MVKFDEQNDNLLGSDLDNIQITDEQDLQLLDRINTLLREDSSNLRKLYNAYRVGRGLEPVDFEALYTESDQAPMPVLVLCMQCLLQAFKNKDGMYPSQHSGHNQSMFDTGIFRGMGQHQDKLQVNSDVFTRSV